MDGSGLLLAAAALHLGLQWLVHVVVYPGLADQARAAPEHAAALHARYTTRMGVAVGPVYAVLALAVVVALLDGPRAWALAAALLSLAVVAVTAALAVPLHRALSRPDADEVDRLHRRLLAVDRLRLSLAAALLAAAVVDVATR